MSIKPIDFQVMIPKMPEVAKLQGSDAARQHLASQQGVQDTKQMVEADVKGVYKKKDVQKVTPVDEEDREEHAGGSGHKGKNKKNYQNEKDKNSSKTGKNTETRPRSIDIKL